MWQFGGNAGATVIGKHDQPVKAVHWVPNLNLVATASWDATVRFWDTRSPTEALKIPLAQKVRLLCAYVRSVPLKPFLCG